MALKRTFDSLTPMARKWRMFPGRWKARAGRLMLAIGAYVAVESKKRAPILTGDLEAAHRVVMTRNDASNVRVEIQVGDDKTADYLQFIHESSYGLGPLSRKKQAANPKVRVGSKFLERAMNETEDEIVKQIADELFGEVS